MMSCWRVLPEERPSFNEVTDRVAAMLRTVPHTAMIEAATVQSPLLPSSFSPSPSSTSALSPTSLGAVSGQGRSAAPLPQSHAHTGGEGVMVGERKGTYAEPMDAYNPMHAYDNRVPSTSSQASERAGTAHTQPQSAPSNNPYSRFKDLPAFHTTPVASDYSTLARGQEQQRYDAFIPADLATSLQEQEHYDQFLPGEQPTATSRQSLRNTPYEAMGYSDTGESGTFAEPLDITGGSSSGMGGGSSNGGMSGGKVALTGALNATTLSGDSVLDYEQAQDALPQSSSSLVFFI